MGYAGWDENPGFSSHLAEGEGFEPPVPEGTAVFETAPFGHSGTPPRDIFSVVPPACGKGGIPRSAGQVRTLPRLLAGTRYPKAHMISSHAHSSALPPLLGNVVYHMGIGW